MTEKTENKSGVGAALVALVGAPVAAFLLVSTAQHESGRTATATPTSDSTAIVLKHVRGRQFLNAYIDMVGVPTICDGITTIDGRKVRKGEYRNEDQCAELLAHELYVHAKGALACAPELGVNKHPGLEKALQGPRYSAISLTYNVGIGGFCGSTARKRFNNYDLAGGCVAQTWWNKAGGRVVSGLKKRRAAEYNVCMKGIPA